MIRINLGKNIIKKPRTTHPPDHIDYIERGKTVPKAKYTKYLAKEYRRADIYTIKECKEIIERIFKIIGDKLVECGEVDIEDFGKFKAWKGYIGRLYIRFTPCARFVARMNPDNKSLVHAALKDKKVMSLDFDIALKESKPKMTRNRKKIMLDEKDVDVQKIFEKLEKAQYRSWRKR